jgi:hypothetical protein
MLSESLPPLPILAHKSMSIQLVSQTGVSDRQTFWERTRCRNLELRVMVVAGLKGPKEKHKLSVSAEIDPAFAQYGVLEGDTWTFGGDQWLQRPSDRNRIRLTVHREGHSSDFYIAFRVADLPPFEEVRSSVELVFEAGVRSKRGFQEGSARLVLRWREADAGEAGDRAADEKKENQYEKEGSQYPIEPDARALTVLIDVCGGRGQVGRTYTFTRESALASLGNRPGSARATVCGFIDTVFPYIRVVSITEVVVMSVLLVTVYFRLTGWPEERHTTALSTKAV